MTLIEKNKLARLIMLTLLPVFGGLAVVAIVALSAIA